MDKHVETYKYISDHYLFPRPHTAPSVHPQNPTQTQHLILGLVLLLDWEETLADS